MATTDIATNAVTQFSAVLETPWRPGLVLPILTLMLNEDRGGGWSGTIHINPRLASPEDALQTLMVDGLVPGTAATVKLVVAGSTGHTGTAVRIWPSVVTSVNCTTSSDVKSPDALCIVTFRDPDHLSAQQANLGGVWRLSRWRHARRGVVGSCGWRRQADADADFAGPADGSDRSEDLREELAQIPYAIAVGEPFGYWLNRVFGRLGARFEVLGEPTGVLKVSVLDAVPTETVLNRDGGVDMTFDPALPASATNLTLTGIDVNAGILRRGGMLDNPSGGGARRFGPPGALESVSVASETGMQEAEHRGWIPADQPPVGAGPHNHHVVSARVAARPRRQLDVRRSTWPASRIPMHRRIEIARLPVHPWCPSLASHRRGASVPAGAVLESGILREDWIGVAPGVAGRARRGDRLRGG